MATAAEEVWAESQRQADRLKEEGNALFRKERLSAASDAYIGVRPDDLRRPFGKFGRVKDIYLPKDYYTGKCWAATSYCTS